jgi:hypothetical protein
MTRSAFLGRVGREKLFVHPRLMRLLTRDSNAFQPYRQPGA